MKVLVLLLIFMSYMYQCRATVTLTSTLDGRRTACPREVLTYTCTVLRTSSITWFALPDINGAGYFPNSPLGHQTIRGFQLALTNRIPDPLNPTILADLTITLTFTATLARNGTVVECRGDDPSERMSLVLNIAGLPPSPPQNPGYHVQHYGPHNVTVTVQWGYPEFDGGVPVDNYTISGTNIMTTTSQINETTLTLPYNARQTVEVAATNCIGASRTTTFNYFEAGCVEPIPPSRGSIDNFQSAEEGVNITYSCNPGLIPGTQMSAVCTNMTWRPDPASLQCRGSPPDKLADCGTLPPPINGFFLQPHTNTTEGSVVVFQCDPGFVPEGEMTAVCGRDGQWTPNPGGTTCSSSTQTFTETSSPTSSYAPNPTGPGTTAEPLNTGVVIAVSIITSSVVSFLVGSLFGAVIYHCFTKRTSKPVYETEVHREIEMKGNISYEQHRGAQHPQ